MPDPSLEETNDLLRRLVAAVERKELGLTADPPGSVTLYANRVKAPDGCVWYRWDPQAEEPIVVEHQYVRGRLTDLVCYEKSSPEGTTTKVRACLTAGRTRYEIETTLTATSGRGLASGLVEAGEKALKRPITIGAEPADKDQVLFMSVFTDEGGKQYPDSTPEGLEALVSALKTVRSWMGLDPDPWTERFSTSEPHNESTSSSQRQQGPPPRGQQPNRDDTHQPAAPEGSATRQRERHKSEEMYDTNGRPSPREAGQKLVNRVQKQHSGGELAREIRLNGKTLPEKIRGFNDYAGRDTGYLARVTDALGAADVEEVAVAQLKDLVGMILDEEMLRQNESFEPDDDLPF